MAFTPTRTGSSLWYIDVFDVTTGELTLTINGNLVTMPAGSYIMDSNAAAYLADYGVTQDFGTALKTAINAVVADATWAVTLTSNYYVQIARSTNFTLGFPGTTAGQKMQALLGYPTWAGAATTTATGTRTPWHFLSPSIAGRSEVSDLYESPDIVTEAVTDDGYTYGVARQTADVSSDWVQSMEPAVNVFDRANCWATFADLSDSSMALVGWTWQAFFRNVRGQHPFLVLDDQHVTYTMHKLRAEGAAFHPERVAADDDTYWRVRFATRDLGLATL